MNNAAVTNSSQPISVSPEKPLDVVCLSGQFDLKHLFSPNDEPRIRLLRPEEVEDPTAIECALCWGLEDDAFTNFPNVRMAASIAAGVDGILRCPSLPEPCVVTRVRDEAQAAMMAGFAAWNVVWHHRKLGRYIEAQKEGIWDRTFRPKQSPDVTVGVLGYGLMGRAVARTLATMGYSVRVAARKLREPEPGVTLVTGGDAIAKVAASSEILINVLPLTDSTRDILNRDLFAQMPRGAVLIQIGRGEHLVEEDLLEALANGQLSAATLDVFRQEPLPAEHPFWRHPDILITPHKASDTTRNEAIRQMLDNFLILKSGQTPPGAVDRSSGY